MRMSLTLSDLQEIRSIVEQTVQPLQHELQALRNDIKEIYDMISELQTNSSDSKFGKLSLQEQILELNSKLVRAAKQAGINLPR
jgi:peptidoglycan hydrolase CwlO-like protein